MRFRNFMTNDQFKIINIYLTKRTKDKQIKNISKQVEGMEWHWQFESKNPYAYRCNKQGKKKITVYLNGEIEIH